jgi:hypothetical protein
MRNIGPKEGLVMSYVDRMSWRMLGSALVPIALGGVSAWLWSALLDLLHLFGGQPVFSDLPFQIVVVGVGAGAVISTYQILRLWRWTRGKGAVCYVCGCLLGRERDGRYGPYRKCLGCGKNHSLSSALSE